MVRPRVKPWCCAFAMLAFLFAGCCLSKASRQPPPGVPHETAKLHHAEYIIGPPDVLILNAARLVPQAPYKLQPLDELEIYVTATLPNQPIGGKYKIDPEGKLNLGYSYGTFGISEMTTEGAQKYLSNVLKGVLKMDFQVSVSLYQASGLQQIRGEHLVRQDGTIGLGSYGSPRVSGLTLEQAKTVIESVLRPYLSNPDISLDVAGFNSRVYYVITDGGGAGELVVRVPVTGNETVLDAISQINGLPQVASKKRIWVARPPHGEAEPEQTLPVDWVAITQSGKTETNYQIFPGDRVYVQAQPLVTADTYLARAIAPIERLLGVTLLGSVTVNSITNRNNQNGFGRGF